MGIMPVQAKQVQIESAGRGDGTPEFLGEAGVEVAQRFGQQGNLPNQEGPATQIDRCGHQGFVHWHGGVAITANAGLVAQRLGQRLAQADADVLDRVMGIDVQIALGLDGEVDEAVLAQQREHMIEEADAAGDVGLAGAVEVEGEVDFGFAGLAAKLCGASHGAPELSAPGFGVGGFESGVGGAGSGTSS